MPRLCPSGITLDGLDFPGLPRANPSPPGAMPDPGTDCRFFLWPRDDRLGVSQREQAPVEPPGVVALGVRGQARTPLLPCRTHG
jgi:hypothetical protein